ncbi:MAG TPA: hypothetical protein VMT60_01135, partial [Candidatus Bathyarchaeia archaeon]|nr:hypothetical protein [Candidatus Bathyarchaeia archaeon]
LVYLLCGVENLTAVFVVQGVLSSLVVPLMYVVASRTWNERTGLAAATASAVYPDFLFYNTAVHAESLVVLCVVAMMAVAVSRFGDARKACAQGALLGGAVLLETGLVFLLPGLIVTVRRRLLFLGACLVILAPWIVESSVASRTFAPVRCIDVAAHGSIVRYYEASGSVYRVLDGMYVNAISLYNWHPESPVIKSAGGLTKLNGVYFLRKYSYLVLLFLGTFAGARYFRREHLAVALPAFLCAVALVLLSIRSEGRFRMLLEPLLILYLSVMVADRRGESRPS